MVDKLKNPPLAEVIFELKWKIKETDGLKKDPNYKIFVGRFYDKIMRDYPKYESLPSANIPDDISAYIIQHRFRIKENSWPIVQIGQGILSVNHGKDYDWNDFSKRIVSVIKIFFSTYPDKNLEIESIKLRYINTIDADFNKDITALIEENFNLSINISDNIIGKKAVSEYVFAIAAPAKSYSGIIAIKLGKGKNIDTDCLILDNVASCPEPKLSFKPNDNVTMKLIENMHKSLEDVFFKLIKDKLRETFK